MVLLLQSFLYYIILFIKLTVQSSLKGLITVIGEDADLLVSLFYHAQDKSKQLLFKSSKR